jgi:hypothetical protein
MSRFATVSPCGSPSRLGSLLARYPAWLMSRSANIDSENSGRPSMPLGLGAFNLLAEGILRLVEFQDKLYAQKTNCVCLKLESTCPG